MTWISFTDGNPNWQLIIDWLCCWNVLTMNFNRFWRVTFKCTAESYWPERLICTQT